MSRALIVLDTEFQRRKAADWAWSLKHGTRVEFKAPKRTDDQNSLMWVLLTKMSVQLKWHGRHLTPDDWKLQFLDALRRAKNEELRIVPNIDNTGFVNLSTSSSDLSKDEMSDLIELIYKFGAEHGVQLGEQEPSVAPHAAGEEGSDGSTPSPDTQAVAADQSLSQESGTEAGAIEAEEEPTAAPASDLPPVKRMLMEELIDNMLRDAFSEPAIDRPAKVDKLRDIFLEKQNLGDFPDFVNRCHETARRIIGKPAEKARAREYLMGKIPS